MQNFIAIVILVAIVISASLYIYKAKKNGKKCIGCPCAGSCSMKNTSCNKEN